MRAAAMEVGTEMEMEMQVKMRTLVWRALSVALSPLLTVALRQCSACACASRCPSRVRSSSSWTRLDGLRLGDEGDVDNKRDRCNRPRSAG
jgi:hypothetical protein